MVLALHDNLTDADDERLKCLQATKLKNIHLQNEERVLREKLKVVILNRRINRAEKETKKVTAQLNEALKRQKDETEKKA